MFRIFLFFFAFNILGTLNAQNYTSVAPWDNALSYHPSMVGVHTDESFQMNIFSQRTVLDSSIGSTTFPSFSNLRDFIDFEVALLEPIEVKNAYFLGYQKTVALKRENRITGGLQLQHIKEVERRTENSTSVGFTINYHKPLAKRKNKTRYLSFGYQLNLLFNSPNRSVISAAFNSIDTPRLSFDEFNAQFRNSGVSQSFSVNYHYLREKKTSFQFGVTFSLYNVKTPSRILSTIDGSVFFRTETLFQGRINLDYQQVLGKKAALNLNLLLHAQPQIGLGLGFRLEKSSILNFSYVVVYSFLEYSFSPPMPYANIQVSLDMKRYKYITTFGFNDFQFLKFGVVYRLEDRDTRSMLSINN